MNPLEEPLKMKPMDEEENDSGDDSDSKPSRRSGRRKIKIEYIEDKNRRHITFSKRKAGIMKKAYELSTLTGTQVLLLVVSETGLVYTFTTVKLQPIVTKPEGKNLIQACLNAPDPVQNETSENDTGYQGQQRVAEVEKKSTFDDNKKVDSTVAAPLQQQQQQQQQPPARAPGGYTNGHYQAPQPQQPQPHAYGSNGPMTSMAPNNGYGHPNYMTSPYQPPQQAPPQQHNQPPQQPSPQQQQQQQPPYGQMPGPSYYGNQQVPPQYMQQQQQHGYWAGSNNPSLQRHQEDDKSRISAKKE